MVKFLIICSLFFLCLNGKAQDSCQYYQKYIDSGRTIIMKGGDSADFKQAIYYYNIAMLHCPDSAQSARRNILKVFDKIDSLKQKAERDRLYAIIQEAKARKATKEAEDATKEAKKSDSAAQSERVKSYLQTLSNAPYKYIRLIRDGPKDLDKIKSDSFDIKLIAYCNHLDSLGRIMDSIISKKDTITVDKKEYDKIMENLYYDNDLYEKIYYCFRSYEYEDSIFHTVKYPFGDAKLDQVILADGKRFTPVARDTSSTTSFYATDDNYILVDEKKVDTIAMGTRVTALDFDEKDSLIYFGTISGDIGFIKYGDTTQRKYQPVYDNENSLGSQVTALQVFQYGTFNFLLATAIDRRAVVYKIDSNFLKPGNKFSGNDLPPNTNIAEINNGRFDRASKKVILQTTSKSGEVITYLWNPFTESALEAYKIAIEKKRENYNTMLQDTMNKNKFY